MDETANEIEAQIDRTRARLGANLKELEHRVDAATDWREHFRERPQLFLGVAFFGGVILASALRMNDQGLRRSAPRLGAVGDGNRPGRAQASEFWNNAQAALVGVVSARLKEYIGELVPGFDEHYRRAEQRAAAVGSMSSSSAAPEHRQG